MLLMGLFIYLAATGPSFLSVTRMHSLQLCFAVLLDLLACLFEISVCVCFCHTGCLI